MCVDINDFQRGIFALGTNFGELAQLMVQKLEGFTPANGKYYDLLDSQGNKIEVKFSRAKKKLEALNATNVVEYCLNWPGVKFCVSVFRQSQEWRWKAGRILA